METDSKKTVLIVEDELIAAESLKKFLEKNGYTVLGRTDRGEKAVEMAQNLLPDLVLMDIMLKDGLSGSEAALRISRLCNTKIVFVTAYAEDEMLEYAVECRAAGYLIKPYNKTQILTTLRLIFHDDTEKPLASQQLLIDNFIFDCTDEQLYQNDTLVKLGPLARRLLTLLCKTPNKSVANEYLMKEIWGKEVENTLLRALVYRTRMATSESLIENVSSSGYMIVVPTPIS